MTHRSQKALLTLLVSLAVATSVKAAELDVYAEATVEWLRSKGGVWSSKLDIRRSNPDDPNSWIGVFANEKIPSKELLLSVPPACLITNEIEQGELVEGSRIEGNFKAEGQWYSGILSKVHPDDTVDIDYDDGDKESRVSKDLIRAEERGSGSMDCGTVRNLIKEMRLGDDSEFAPFVNYMLAQPYGQLPSAWSDAGKDLYLEVLGEANDKHILPPSEPVSWIIDGWHRICRGSDDPFEENAAMLCVQRGWDEVLIPLYDLLNHRNGRWLNTESNSVDEIYKGGNVEVSASRDIEEGEEVYGSYNFCTDCGGRKESYGTPEMLRDYGFVENYPQRYLFPLHNVRFDIDQKLNDDGTVSDELEVTWIGKKPNDRGVKFLVEQLQRLMLLGDTVLESPTEGIPKNEWDVIKEYHEALMVAFRHAIEASGSKTYDENCLTGEGECLISSNSYDNLDWKKDGLPYSMYTCDTSVSMGFAGYESLEKITSPYQQIDFIKDPDNDDVCFDLDGIVQICGSYRPHYHEMVVHYTARFLENIKRVVWVGGGDSMLLHEIIKYPNLELVIGLELDQKVTRNSFKHFGTQPHWDNDKVQWWYGDATKSLLMLPEEYFGSFDMVLVDLSETVMSFLVTKELDVMEALSLLLKPEGIFVKNELYLEKLSDIFDYTIQIHYYDVPVICSQALIMGSNKVDFLYRDPKDHNIDNLYVRPLDPKEDKYGIYHDYRRNHTSVQKHCADTLEPEPEPEEQEKSPGILLVLETENVGIKLQDSKAVKGTIEKALKKEGLKVKSAVVSSSEGKGDIIVAVLREGYVVARTWPEHKYVAFDIHLWSSFEKQEGIKKALIKAVGSNNPSSSSFRIVAGGMFGVSTWKDDVKNRGPRITHLCDPRDKSVREKPSDQKAIDAVLDETMNLVQDKDFVVGVVCGVESEPCSGLEVLKKNTNVGEVVPIWTCPNLLNENEYSEGSSKHMLECEKTVLNTLKESLPGDRKLRAIVFDTSAQRPISQVVYKIFETSRWNRQQYMTFPDVLVMAPMVDLTEDWRRNLMERFRTDVIYYEPLFRAEVKYNTSDTSMEIGVTSGGDVEFFQHLVDVVAAVEKRTGLVSEVRNVQGGFWNFMDDFVPSEFFLPGDYDQSSPLEQWTAQQPLGHQTIFQIEDEKTPSDLSAERVKANVERSLEHMTDVKMEEYTDVGDGSLIVALWQGGSAIVTWDGKIHVDINLFTYEESVDNADIFANRFKAKDPKLKTVLRDEQPRGYGRVVNFLRDIEPRARPHWA